MISSLDYLDIKFPVNLNRKITSALMYFVMNMIWFILFMYQIKKFENCIDLLLIIDKIRCIMFISKILIDLCAIKQKTRIKNTFADIVHDVLVVKKF